MKTPPSDIARLLACRLESDFVAGRVDPELCIDRLSCLGEWGLPILQQFVHTNESVDLAESLAVALGTVRCEAAAPALWSLAAQSSAASVRAEAFASLSWYPSRELPALFEHEMTRRPSSGRCAAVIAGQIWMYEIVECRPVYMWLMAEERPHHTRRVAKDALRFTLSRYMGRDTEVTARWQKMLDGISSPPLRTSLAQCRTDISGRDRSRVSDAIRRLAMLPMPEATEVLEGYLEGQMSSDLRLDAISALIDRRAPSAVTYALDAMGAQEPGTIRTLSLALEDVYDPRIATALRTWFVVGGDLRSAVEWPIALQGWKYPELRSCLTTLAAEGATDVIREVATSACGLNESLD